MRVFKFGGASVKDANGVRNMVNVLQEVGYQDTLVVISAMGKITNSMETVVESYFKNKDNVGNPNDETMIIKIIKKRLKDISDTYDLINVED